MIPFGAVVGIWLSWTVLAKRLRRLKRTMPLPPEFFEVRFGDKTGIRVR